MRQILPLTTYCLRRSRTLIVTIAGLLALFQFVLIAVGESISNSGQFAAIERLFPPFVRALVGPEFASFLSFRGIIGLGYFHPAVLGAVVALAVSVATRLAADVENGFSDLILARPLARHWMVTASLAAMTLGVVTAIVSMIASTRMGLWIAPPAAPPPELATTLRLGANLAMLGWCWGGIALAAASGVRRRGAAGGTAGILALIAFLLDYVARLWSKVEPLARLSPFRYYVPLPIVGGSPIPAQSAVVLLATAITCSALAYVVFARRDIGR